MGSNEVTIHVRNCSRFIGSTLWNTEPRYTNSLCVCGQAESSMVSNRVECDTARSAICSITTPTNSTDGFRVRFQALCHACEGPLGFESEVCIMETMRAVSLLETRGLCNPNVAPWIVLPKQSPEMEWIDGNICRS